MHTFEAGLHTVAPPPPWAVHLTCALGSNKGWADIRGIYIVHYEAHKMVQIVRDIIGSTSCTLQLVVCANQSHSLAEEGLLWIVHPSQSFASISC